MIQNEAWEREYQNLTLLTGKAEPQKDVTRFLKYLKKRAKLEVKAGGLRILDLGSGTGRNTNYLADFGNDCVGLEISQTALKLARERALDDKLEVDFRNFDIGSAYPFEDKSFDLILDITSSNSLDENGRKIYLQECARVLKNNGYIFVKALCKDGDKNAQNLLKMSPGKQKDTYIMEELGLIERVFSREDFETFYGEYFKIVHLEKKTTYTQFNNQSYKRNFFISYMKKI